MYDEKSLVFSFRAIVALCCHQFNILNYSEGVPYDEARGKRKRYRIVDDAAGSTGAPQLVPPPLHARASSASGQFEVVSYVKVKSVRSGARHQGQTVSASGANQASEEKERDQV